MNRRQLRPHLTVARHRNVINKSSSEPRRDIGSDKRRTSEAHGKFARRALKIQALNRSSGKSGGTLSMAIRITCAKCSLPLRIPESLIGQPLSCAKCHALLKVARAPDGTLAVTSIIGNPTGRSATRQSRSHIAPPSISRSIPYLKKTKAVVRCPSCNGVVFVKERYYNKPYPCPHCPKGLVAIVPGPGLIPLDCPHCGEEMEIRARMAGKTTVCSNLKCNRRITVPTSGVLVREPRTSSGAGDALVVAAAAIAIGVALSGRGTCGRTCLRCGRYLRNPSNYCYVCQQR